MNASSLFKTIDSANDSLSRGGFQAREVLGNSFCCFSRIIQLIIQFYGSDTLFQSKAGFDMIKVITDLHLIKESDIQIGAKML